MGIISNPAKSVKQLRLRIGSLDILISALNYKVPLPTNPGDSKTYSTDSDGNEAATIKHLADGTLEINGNSDFAVAFNDLKTEFDKLNSEYNKLVTRMLAWTPVPTDGGTALKVAITAPPSVAVSGSVIDNVKVGSVKLP